VIPDAVTDALDTCWGCGSLSADGTADGRGLCSTCRSNIADEPDVDPLQLVRGSYWEAHVLVSCWRCMTGAVAPEDDVGLCAPCRGQLGAPDI